MKRTFITALFICMVATSGCASISPRNNPKINNQNGKIDEIKNNQNGIMADIGKLKQDAEIQNSKLKEVQNGLLNLNAAVSRNENSGVQILQGDGALIMVFSLAVIGMLLYWYRDRAVTSEKAADLMAKEIAKFNDPSLNDNILRSAMHKDLEKHIFGLLSKNREELYKLQKEIDRDKRLYHRRNRL